MNVIKELVDDFLSFDNEPSHNYKEFLDNLQSQLYDLNKDVDKIEFIHLTRNGLESQLTKHEETCKNPETCQFSKGYEMAFYFMDQELEELGIQKSDDHFTFDEQYDQDSKLDEILEEVQKLRKGQEIIYDDLFEEMAELKKMYFLKKKNWNQLFLGKLTELTINGLNQEVTNRIMNSIKDTKFLE
ncbi:MAG: hypothetical protein OCD76_17430 [Reichenbachiella sp.]